MDFGFTLPMRGQLAAPENLAALARRGDELGFGLLACSDHIVFPNTTASPYPYGQPTILQGPGDHLELITTLGWLFTRAVLTSYHTPPGGFSASAIATGASQRSSIAAPSGPGSSPGSTGRRIPREHRLRTSHRSICS